MATGSPRPELLALLAAVKADPGDDTVKLVLADWLQEQDDEADRARGEFVREAAKYDRLGIYHPDRSASARRREALWEKYHGVWLGPLLKAGFEIDNWSDHQIHVSASISGIKVVGKKALATTTSEAYAWVDSLSLDEINSAQLTKFANSPFLDSLTDFILLGERVSEDSVAAVVTSPRAAGLQHLLLQKMTVPVEAIANSPSMARLRSLDLQQTRLTDAGFKALCDSPHLNSLWRLEAIQNRLTIHAARAFAEAKGLAALTRLNLGRNRIGPKGTEILVSGPNAGRLSELILWSNGVTDQGVEAICKQKHLCNLTHLSLNGNLLTNRSAVAIAAAKNLRGLWYLDLESNGISSVGAFALANSPYLANITRLELERNRIGRKAWAALDARFGDAMLSN
ncbi:MAG: hypothetical protein C0467_21440 [Planctomycetaceae bacterium]|nr:hypothetical protein [Planctomycetaceae bacterium]